MDYLQQMTRVEQLLNQGRNQEAEQILKQILANHPDSESARYMLAAIYHNNKEFTKAEEILHQLIEESPDIIHYHVLMSAVELELKKHESAKNRLDGVLSSDPEHVEAILAYARYHLSKNNYDGTLACTDRALALESDNVDALNLRTLVASLLGKTKITEQAGEESLRQDPNNPTSIAVHGIALLNQGKVNEALERFREALVLDPSNEFAKDGLMSAMKNRFWPYKLFYQFGIQMSRLSQKNMWVVIIGSYLLVRVMGSVADNNEALKPFLMPVIFIIVGIFLLTWVFEPLMNAYLLTNKYGRHLLTESQKITARFVLGSICLALFFFVLNFFMPFEVFLLAGLLFLAFMIPLSRFDIEKPRTDKQQLFIIAIIAVGILGLLALAFFNSSTLFTISLLGIFLSQWIFNASSIKESGRTYH